MYPPPQAPRRRAPLVERVVGWSARNRAIALLGWLVLVAVAVTVGQLSHTDKVPSYDPGEAGRAERTLHSLNVDTPTTEQVLIQSTGHAVPASADPEVRGTAADVAAALRAVPAAATDVRAPFAADGSVASGDLVSADGRSVLVTFQVPGDQGDAADTMKPARDAVAAVAAHHPDLRVEETGSATVNDAVGDAVSHDMAKAETFSLPITLLLLLVVFGGLMAAGIPLLLAGGAVGAAIGLLAIPGHWLPIDDSTSEVVLLIGMAVGVDYTLFYLRREREARLSGEPTTQAIRTAGATAGHAVVVSGLTVMASLAGLFLSGIDIFSGVAVGTIIVVGAAVLGSLTALPAILSLLGQRVDRGRLPFIGRRRTVAVRSRAWEALVRQVVRRPVVFGTAAAAVLVVLALPALGLRSLDPGSAILPADAPVVQTMKRVQTAFPSGPEPAEIVVTGDALTRPAVADAVHALSVAAERPGDNVYGPVTAAPVADGRALLLSVPLGGDGSDAASQQGLADLRGHLLPSTVGSVSGLHVDVAGSTAAQHDFASALRERMWWVMGAVAALALILMLVSFRSPVIAVTTVVLNLLSVGAACGVTTWVFQDGHFAGALDFQPYGGIVSWVPLFMAVILFGLSTDYHVFVISRIREARLGGLPTRAAIIRGIGTSAGVVSSAAVIMAAVFAIFAFMSVISMKMLGVGMATAVILDATLVRGLLIPAVMSLLGEANWALPRWLRWLPGRDVPAALAPPVVAPERPVQPVS